MSYIELGQGAPSTKKAVMSLWFRVPGTTIAAVAATREPPFDNEPPLNGIIPLMTFGPPPKRRRLEQTTGAVVGSWPRQNYTYNGITYTPVGASDTVEVHRQDYNLTPEEPTSPSFIGVEVDELGRAGLTVRIVMPIANKAVMDGGVVYEILDLATNTDMDGLYFGNVTNCVTLNDGPLAAEYTITQRALHSDAQKILGANAEVFSAGGFHRHLRDGDGEDAFDNGAPRIPITADHWHHALISFDFTSSISLAGYFVERVSERECLVSGSCGGALSGSYQIDIPGQISRACRMYIALDDRNRTGINLTKYRSVPGGTRISPNEIVTENGYKMLTDRGADIADTSCVQFARKATQVSFTARPTFDYQPAAVPFAPLGFPGTGHWVNNIHHVEMGEFQLFANTAINTGNESSRRLFITQEGKPTSMKVPAKAFGHEPHVKLHGSGNWQKAKNTGTYQPGEGTPVGQIDKYKPDPSLHGKQGNPQ